MTKSCFAMSARNSNPIEWCSPAVLLWSKWGLSCNEWIYNCNHSICYE